MRRGRLRGAPARVGASPAGRGLGPAGGLAAGPAPDPWPRGRPAVRRRPDPGRFRPRPAGLPRRSRGRAPRATARQATPSPRPSAPSPSGRLPLTVTGAPPPRPGARAWPRRGRQPGGVEHHGAVDVPIARQPAARTSATARHSRSIESAPAHAGSVSGKCWPMSPSPAAPSSASVTAWATTSASLWPTRPGSPGNAARRRARGAGPGRRRRGGRRSPARPAGRGVSGHGAAPRHRQVGGPGDLEVGGDPSTTTTLPPAASTSDASSVASALLGVRGPQAAGPERLRGLHRHQPVAVDHPAAATAERVGHRDAGHRGVGPAHAPDHGGEQGGVGQRPGAVVHHDHLGVVGGPGQAGPHRARPGARPRHHRVGSRLVVVLVAGRPRARPRRPCARATPGPATTLRAASSDQSSTRRPARGSYCFAAPKARPSRRRRRRPTRVP